MLYNIRMNAKEIKKIKISLVMNAASFLIFAVGLVFMLIGFQFMGYEKRLSATTAEAFRFFTVDSNVIAGIACLIMVIFEIRLLKGKTESLPAWLYSLKHIATVGVAITFFTVLLILAPFFEGGFFALYMNSNLFFHLIIPLLCMISFMFFEGTRRLRFGQTFLGIITMLVYGVFYAANVMTHMSGGQVSSKYDWYGLFSGTIAPWPVMMAIMVVMAWIISFLLWLINRKTADSGPDK